MKLQFIGRSYDDIEKRWDYFYKLPHNSLDIVILGNSHAYSSYNPDIIDAICGTNSFVLASNSQRIEQVYYNLKEVLKYHSPKLAVIQSTTLANTGWKSEEGDYRIYSNLDGMRYSFNKMWAATAQRPVNDLLNTMFPLIRNHQNWKEGEFLNKNLKLLESHKQEDFRGFSPRNSEMGNEVAKKYEQEEKVDYSDFSLSQHDIGYLKRLKKLADINDVKIVHVTSPNYGELLNLTYSKKYEVLQRILSEYGYEYFDFNMMADTLGIQKRSFENGYISYQHTSNFGAVQISKFLGSYFKEEFFLDDSSSNDLINQYWTNRMRKKVEYYLFGNKRMSKNPIYEQLGKDLILFDDVIVKKMFLLKRTEDKTAELVLQFGDNLNSNKLSRYKFYLHLYPYDGDTNIKDDRKALGFENYDFFPNNLPVGDGSYYLSVKIDTKIKTVKIMNLGLFKKGFKKSETITVKDFKL